MKHCAIFLITLYQVYLSPYKGYRCAYGVLYNQGSCSERVKFIIRDDGVIHGWRKITDQFHDCSDAYDKIEEKKKKSRKEQKKEGDKDSCLDCVDPCDLAWIASKICKKGEAGADLPCDCSF